MKVNSEQTYHIKDENEQCLKRIKLDSITESEQNTHPKVKFKEADEESDFCFVLGYN